MIDKLVKFFGEVAFVELHVDDALWTGNRCYNLAKKNFLFQKNKKRTPKTKTKKQQNPAVTTTKQEQNHSKTTTTTMTTFTKKQS